MDTTEDKGKRKGFRLQNGDPEPVTLIEGISAMIFAGPHNGHAVPACLAPYLGTDKNWFETAHEARDLHVSRLFDVLIDKRPDDSFIWGNYSRLVCDLNRKADEAITLYSSEYSHITIPENMPDSCCSSQSEARLRAIYDPYHNAQSDLIESIRERNGGLAVILELHSFNPTWEQKKRDVEIGTIRYEKTPLSRTLEGYLKDQDEYHFVSGEPYRVADRPANAARHMSEVHDIQFLGIEIRHDLIATPEGISKMSKFLSGCIKHLENAPNFPLIAAPRSHAIMIDNKNRMSHLGLE